MFFLAIHIHLIDFQVISRTGGRNAVQPYEAVALKDVVLLGTNEKVRVIAKYVPWDGVYMFHCDLHSPSSTVPC